MSEPREGVLDRSYHEKRQSKRSHRYRLWRRGEEVKRILDRHGAAENIRRVLDVGTADGAMLKALRQSLPADVVMIGADLSLELLETVDTSLALPVNCNAAKLPLADETFDFLIATAVIEHVGDPRAFLRECRRVLRPDGVIVLTTPNPFFDDLATKLGLLEDEQHTETFDLGRLAELLKESGFQVLEMRRFMLSPIGMPLERPLEDLLRFLGLQGLMANQLAAARKPVKTS